MNLRSLAIRIPDEVRSERLLISQDPIGNAQPFGGNGAMQLLFAIWYEYIEPDKKSESNMGCPFCIKNILDNFRAMKDELMLLEKEYLLLQSIS